MVEWWNDGIMQDIRALFHVALIPATVRYVRSAAWVHLVTATILKGWKSFSPGLRPPSAVLLTEGGGTPAAPKLRAKAGATLGWRAGNQNYPEKGCITLLTELVVVSSTVRLPPSSRRQRNDSFPGTNRGTI